MRGLPSAGCRHTDSLAILSCQPFFSLIQLTTSAKPLVCRPPFAAKVLYVTLI